MSKAPCRGSSNCLLFFYSCPYRALAVCVRLPRAMPWAMETLGFQPVFAQTLLFTSLRKRYCSRPCANVIGHVLAILCGIPLPTSYIPILVSFVFLLIKLFFHPDFCYVICSGCVRDDCWLFILVVIPYIFILVISCAPQRGNFSTAQGIALGMM